MVIGLVEISSSMGFRTEWCLSTFGNRYSIMVRMFERHQVRIESSRQCDHYPFEWNSRESRKNLDTQETYKAFGPLIIDFSKIQSKIGVKYDNWHQDLLRKFGQIIQTIANEFHTSISEVRKLFSLPPSFSFGSSLASNESRNEICRFK